MGEGATATATVAGAVTTRARLGSVIGSGGAAGGGGPNSLFVGESGAIYGASTIGGVGYNGDVYELTTGASGYQESILHAFTGPPDGSHPYYGLALLDNHQPAEAAAQFSEELRLTPNETKAHFRLAQALQQQNKLAEAVVQYRAALRLTPDFPEAKSALDQILSVNPSLKTSEPLDTSK